jgi:hypothetical protein
MSYPLFLTKVAFFALKYEKKQEKVCVVEKKQYLCTANAKNGCAR